MTTPKSDPKQLGTALAALRWRSGKTQQELEQDSGITQPSISRYEKGEKTPGADNLQRLLDALGEDQRAYAATIHWLNQTRRTAPQQDPLVREWDNASVEAGRRMAETIHRLAVHLAESEVPPEFAPFQEPRPADDWDYVRELRTRLERHPEERWPHLFKWAPDFRNWRICELLCDESLEVADGDPQQALVLAERARKLDRYMPHWERGSYREAFILFHVSHAWHRQGELERAWETAKEAWALWNQENGPRPEPRHEARVQSLYTALLCERDVSQP
jgi:transcriptional regulator with XRE-family HTH domain